MRTINLTFEDEAFNALDERKKEIQKVYSFYTKWEDVVFHAIMLWSYRENLKGNFCSSSQLRRLRRMNKGRFKK